MDEDEDDEESVWMTNIIERYENRPDNEKFEEMSLAEFCSQYRVLAKSQVPKGHNKSVYKLQNGKGYIQQRTRSNPAVIRYPRFSSEKAPEKYYQSILQLYLPHRKGEQLKPHGFELYETFYENGYICLFRKRNLQSVKSIVDKNRACFAMNEDIINSAQEVYDMVGEPEDAWAQLCPESELSRRECMSKRKKTDLKENDTGELIPDIQCEFSTGSLSYVVEQNNSTKQQILPILQSLNETQKEIFYHVREWCLKKIAGQEIDPLHIFVTGGAGTGKSHLIKAIHYEAERLFRKTLSSPDCVSVVLTAFTGTAAFNIGGNTIHKVFSLTKFLPVPYEPLKEQTLSALRVKLESLQILVIDEVSMVYKRLLYYLHERLVQIKRCKKPFGGVTVLAVGDFFQLPPVKQSKNERLYKENGLYPEDHWLELFKLVELKEVMRQREDVPFAMFLNTLRIRTKGEKLLEETKGMLKSCIREGPEDALHVYSTNDEVNSFNLTMLKKTSVELVQIDALDYQKDKTTGKLSLRESPISNTKLDGLSASILFSVNARVMLIRNINVDDGLVNGVMGYISYFISEDKNGKDCIKAIGVQFDNENVGARTGKKIAKGHIVLIERIEEEVKINKSNSIVRHQFPLKLSWACTAHKVQGMTANQVVVNLDKSFSPGQAYVALSRVTSMNGLFIETANEAMLEKKIHADDDVISSTEKMPLLFPNGNLKSTKENCIKIILHNIQSLAGNFESMKHDHRFWNADILCLTETWLAQGQDTTNLQIEDYNFCHTSRAESYNSSNNYSERLRMSKAGGVGMYSRKNLNAVVAPICGENIECIALTLIEDRLILVNIYRPSALPAKEFLNALENVVEKVFLPGYRSIIVGDFNEDANIGGPVHKFMLEKGFTQVVNFPTTEQQTVLDLVYTTCPLQVETIQIPTFYSYHEAVLINLKK